jgi:hypothetical protein
MDKLTGLLKQLGGSDELVGAISEQFRTYAQGIKEQYDAEFNKKITKARAICLEAVNKEKAEIARKVAIYLESKQDHFDRAAERQRLNEESESANMLKRVKALMEGISVDDGQSQELQVTRRQIARLQQAVGTLKEERDVAVTKANKANGIATNFAKKNRILENKFKSSGALNESKSRKSGSSKGSRKAKSSKAVVIAESKTSNTRRTHRLDESRRVPSRSVSTRVIKEETRRSSDKGGDSNIANIAANMNE